MKIAPADAECVAQVNGDDRNVVKTMKQAPCERCKNPRIREQALVPQQRQHCSWMPRREAGAMNDDEIVVPAP